MKQLWNWLRRARMESDLDRELRDHLDRRIAHLTQSGLPESAARRQATIELGGLTQVTEEVRDVWLTRWLRDFLYDLRYSARSFLRTPAFTATAVLSLALGIGATTAIYSLVDQVILHALPVRQPEHLVLVDWKGDPVAPGFGSWNLMSYPICRDLQLQDRFFEGVLCRAATTVNFSTGAESKPVAAEIVSGTYFTVLGVEPALGRVLGLEDDRTPGASPVVVLSCDFWRTALGAAPDVIGRKIFVNHHPMTIVGVAAPSFRGIDVGEVPSLWIPASTSSQAIPGFTDLLNRRTRWMQVLGRLRPSLTATQAQAGLEPWFKAMLEEDTRRPGFPRITPERLRRFRASYLQITPAPQGHSSLRRFLAEPLWLLFAATAVLLGLACLNVAGLFLARGSARQREITTRLALGASRSRLGRQLLADSVLLALTGGLLGVGLAPLAVRTLIAFLPQDAAANALRATIEPRLLLFAFFVSLAAGILSGFAPALNAGRKSLIDSLRERGGPSSAGAHLRKLIVTAQIAFSLILVIGAVLFARTLIGLLAKGPGFDTSSLISFGLDPRKNGYSPAEAKSLIGRIHDQLRASPTTQSAAMASMQLLNGGSWSDPMTIQSGRRFITDREVDLNSVTPEFFATLGVPIVAGRSFDERDSRLAPDNKPGRRYAIVNQAFVKRYLAGENPLGVRICEGAGPDDKPNVEIIGVMADINYRGLRDQSEQVYFPMSEGDGGSFYIKFRGTPDQALQSIRAIVRNADPTLPISYFRTLQDQVNRSLNTERMLATLSGAFGVLALLLSLVGLYGVMSFVVTQRTRELGIRMALGATRGAAVWLVLRDALAMIAAGVVIALPCVAALGRLVQSQLFQVTATDPVTVLQACLLLAFATFGAALIPACRAAAVNPNDALRLD